MLGTLELKLQAKLKLAWVESLCRLAKTSKRSRSRSESIMNKNLQAQAIRGTVLECGALLTLLSYGRVLGNFHVGLTQ